MADALASGASVLRDVGVQVPLRPPCDESRHRGQMSRVMGYRTPRPWAGAFVLVGPAVVVGSDAVAGDELLAGFADGGEAGECRDPSRPDARAAGLVDDTASAEEVMPGAVSRLQPLLGPFAHHCFRFSGRAVAAHSRDSARVAGGSAVVADDRWRGGRTSQCGPRRWARSVASAMPPVQGSPCPGSTTVASVSRSAARDFRACALSAVAAPETI